MFWEEGCLWVLRNQNMKFALPESCVPGELSKLFYEQHSWGPSFNELAAKPEAQDNQREGWLPLWEAKQGSEGAEESKAMGSENKKVR